MATPGEHLGPWLVTRPLPGDEPRERSSAPDVFVAGRADGGPRGLVALRVQQAGDADAVLERLARSRRALDRLPPQHWARVVDTGSAGGGRVYVATELVEGVPIVQAVRTLSLPDRIRLLLPWLDALADAHRLLLVHGNLRASALRVAAAQPVRRTGPLRLSPMESETALPGQVRAFGLGLAQALASVDDPPIDTAADIRALGRLLHELLKGAPMDIDDADDEPFDSELPVDLRAVIERALVTWRVDEHGGDEANASSLYARSGYAHVDALAADLRAFLDGFPVAAQPATRRYHAWRFVARQPVLTAVGAAIALALLFAWVGSAWQAVRATQVQQRVEARLDSLRMLTRQAVVNHSAALDALPTGASGVAGEALSGELATLEHEAGDNDEWRVVLASAYARLAEQLAEGAALWPDGTAKANNQAARALALAERAWPARQYEPALVGAYALALQIRARALADKAQRSQAAALLDDALSRVDRSLAMVNEAARRPLRARRAALLLDQAKLQAAAGLPDQALGLFEQAELGWKTLLQARAEPALAARLAELHAARSEVLMRQGQDARALADASAALQERQRALQGRPEYLAWRAGLVHDASRVATLSLQGDQAAEAIAASRLAWDEAQALQRRLGSTDASKALLAEAALAHGPALVASGQSGPALPVLDLALASLDEALAKEPDRALERRRASLQLAQARARLAMGDRAGAQAQLAELPARLEALTEPASQPDTRDAWLMLGETQWLLMGLEPRRRADWQQRAAAAYAQAHTLQPLAGEALKRYQQVGGRP